MRCALRPTKPNTRPQVLRNSTLIVYYEALLLRPVEETFRIAQYYGLNIDVETVANVTEALSASNMKKMEQVREVRLCSPPH